MKTHEYQQLSYVHNRQQVFAYVRLFFPLESVCFLPSFLMSPLFDLHPAVFYLQKYVRGKLHTQTFIHTYIHILQCRSTHTHVYTNNMHVYDIQFILHKLSKKKSLFPLGKAVLIENLLHNRVNQYDPDGETRCNSSYSCERDNPPLFTCIVPHTSKSAKILYRSHPVYLTIVVG